MYFGGKGAFIVLVVGENEYVMLFCRYPIRGGRETLNVTMAMSTRLALSCLSVPVLSMITFGALYGRGSAVTLDCIYTVVHVFFQ